ncbi:MAG: 50S ribosomal protein L3 [Candidatus Peribacteria bacterium GW2011_GWB1_54_5]|nr:MAG: 50S ribosomal protein L3 [Candidatus Peribacteria bacterium GW2011_GWB1_54_5]
MSGIIAKKVGMSRIFLEDGEAVAVTYLQVQPNTIVRTKTEGKDGYNAVVLGIEPKKWRTRKGKEHVRYRAQKEWRMESLEGMEPASRKKDRCAFSCTA